MTLEERLKKAENNGYIPIQVPNENFFFFVKDNISIEVGDLVNDCLGEPFKVYAIQKNNRCLAKRI